MLKKIVFEFLPKLDMSNLWGKKNYSTVIFAAIPRPMARLESLTRSLTGPHPPELRTRNLVPGRSPILKSRDFRPFPPAMAFNVTSFSP